MKALILGYGIFLLGFTLFTYLFVDLNLIYMESFYTGFANHNRELVSIIYVVFISVFFLFYFFFLRNINQKILMNLIILSVAFLFLSYPAILSYDIFNYIFTAKILVWYQENPFIVMPIEFLGDPYLSFTHAANKVALYGPSWIGMTILPYLLGFNNFILTLFNFKLFVVVFYFGIIYLIYKFTKNIGNVAYFALSPLVLIETFVSGHNDVSMMFLALLSIYLLKKDKIILALFFLFASVLIKYATIFLLPIFIYYLFLKFKKRKIDWEKIYIFSSLLMFVVFILSPIREEIYPWYGIWFLTFIAITNNMKLKILGFVLSFGLLLRYVPYMYLGTHFGITPALKILVTYIPIIGFLLYLVKDFKNISKKYLRNENK